MEDDKNKGGENLDKENQSDIENLTPEQIAEQEELEQFILEFKDEDYEDTEKLEKLKEAQKTLKTTISQKNHYRDKVKKLEQGSKKTEDTTAAAKADDVKPVFDKADILEFQIDNKLPKDVAQTIAKFAEANKMSLNDALNHDLIKPYVKDKVASAEIDEATVAPRTRGSSAAPTKDWSKASTKDILEQRNRIMRGGK